MLIFQDKNLLSHTIFIKNLENSFKKLQFFSAFKGLKNIKEDNYCRDIEKMLKDNHQLIVENTEKEKVVSMNVFEIKEMFLNLKIKMGTSRWTLYFLGIFLKNQHNLQSVPVSVVINPFMQDESSSH